MGGPGAPATRIAIRAGILVLGAVVLGACGGGGGSSGSPPESLATGPAACTGGDADGFPCSGVSLAARIPPASLGGRAGNDVWGWADPDTGREYALMGLDNGTAFVDVTDPSAPVYLGRMPTETRASVWRDIKVYENHAYVVADDALAHGMQVFDLTRLRTIRAPTILAPDVVYGGIGSAHNVAINEATGHAYVVGADACHGIQIVDITTPVNPLFQACHDSVHGHDAQCVVYAGPDTDHAGAELCFNSNGGHFEILDVTTKVAPAPVVRVTYPGLGFVHQGWLTPDHRYFLLGDELDEINAGHRTRTHVFDVTDLDQPLYVGFHEGPTRATDHNLYVAGERLYEANYTAGLRVLEIRDPAAAGFEEVAYFDTVPGADAAGFTGAWSVYPWLPSGTLLVSDTDNGLFVLTPD